MLDVLIALLMFIGSFFALVASIGLLRMPDLFMRLSAATKAATLGVALVLAAVALYFKPNRSHRPGDRHHRLRHSHRCSLP